MKKQLFICLQKILPQQFLSKLAGYIANCHAIWFKNTLIRFFIWRYKVDLSEAIVKDPNGFSSFNDFFTRKLDMQHRPISENDHHVLSPADGCLSQIGRIDNQQLIQAKGHYFSLESLLASKETAAFTNGYFATIYLAPHNYHRVHMPITGRLKKTVFIPGKLYSVNQITAEGIPNLFGLNERLICYFDTDIGEIAIVLVGALIVGSIKLSWLAQPVKHNTITTNTPSSPIHLAKGDELGCFQLGSTVIMLFPERSIDWLDAVSAGSITYARQSLGYFQNN